MPGRGRGDAGLAVAVRRDEPADGRRLLVEGNGGSTGDGSTRGGCSGVPEELSP
ncbi:hypothetical protein ACFCV3_19360 [Kribbella sp. NPDC056345]|uniref:hypothetical protein n=1 Tax=Kribbella sp. NPDC056345 TaxID=3345789 RepID=UPI0035E38F83